MAKKKVTKKKRPKTSVWVEWVEQNTKYRLVEREGEMILQAKWYLAHRFVDWKTQKSVPITLAHRLAKLYGGPYK